MGRTQADDISCGPSPAHSDSDKMIGFISSRSKRAELGQEPVRQSLLVTRYDPERAQKEECLRLEDIKVSGPGAALGDSPSTAGSSQFLHSAQELLGLELLGVIPESKCILTAINLGQPVICMPDQDAGQGLCPARESRWGALCLLLPAVDYDFNGGLSDKTLAHSMLAPAIFPQPTWTPWSAFSARRKNSASYPPGRRASSRCFSRAVPRREGLGGSHGC